MTTLGSMFKGGKVYTAGAVVVNPTPSLDIPSLVASVCSGGNYPTPLGNPLSVTAAITAWTDQDDDAHEPCSLTACRTPLHPGPCKGWKGILHSVSPGTYKQIEDERVRKANERRLKRIADLRSQNKPIPRRLLTEIQPKPAPNHPAHGVQAVPLGQVNQKADLAGGQAHHSGQSVSQAAGVQVRTAPLPLGPKQKKPSVAGRGPAFVITQPKVTDTYKLDKADKITPQEWAGLTDADKAAIRNELTAIKARGFGPQQTKADALLAKLPAPTPATSKLTPGTPGTITTPGGHTYQKVNLTPGKVTLGQAVKAAPSAPAAHVPAGPTPQAPGAPNNTPRAFAPHVQHARAVAGRALGGRPTAKGHVDTYGKLTKDEFDSLDSVTQRTIRDDLANAKAKFLDPKKKQEAADLLNRFGSSHPAPASPVVPGLGPGGAAIRPATASTPAHVLLTPTNVAKVIRKDGHADLILGGKTIRTGFQGGGHEGTLTFAPPGSPGGGSYTVRTTDGTRHVLGKGEYVKVAADLAPHAKGYSDPQNEAVKAATSGTVDTDNVLKTVARLTPEQVGKLDDPDRKAILGRLAFVATHPKATAEQKAKAAAYGRIVNGRTHVPAGQKLDHAASIGELHAEEQKGGHAAAFNALTAARDKTMTRDDRIKALTALTKPQFDALDPHEQRAVTDALHELHIEKSTALGVPSVRSAEVEKAFDTYTGLNPGVHRLKQAEADFRAGKIDTASYGGFHRELLSARVQAPGDSSRPGSPGDLLEKEAQRVAEDNPTLPHWLRAELIDNRYNAPGGAYYSVAAASNPHNWDSAPRLSGSDINNIFRADVDDLVHVHPAQAEAVKALRAHIIATGLKGQPGAPSGSPWSQATRNEVVDNFLHVSDSEPEVSPARLKEFDALPSMSQVLVRRALTERMNSQTDPHAKVGTFITLHALERRTQYSPEQTAALKTASDRYAHDSALDTYRKLTPDAFDELPPAARTAIARHLDEAQLRAERFGPVRTWTRQDNALKVFPAALKAHLERDRNVWQDLRARNAADIANYGTGIVNPYDRTRAYGEVPIAQFWAIAQGDQDKIIADLDKIANDPARNSLNIRYAAQYTKDFNLGQANLSLEQIAAVGITNPISPQNDFAVSGALTDLDKADFDALPDPFREAIDERIKTLPASQQQAFAAKFHPQAPAASPAGFTPTAPASVQPHVQAALDTIYGVHPSGKSHTMAHQLSTYGALRGSDFAQLNGQEQNHLLADLSFIATTAKGPSGDKARKLIDRFTPAGTPAGQVPTGAVIPPANAVPGQVRYATPLKGLAKAKDSGKSGDGWLSLPGGGRVWGHHGAAGLLLKHTDPQTGEERYLMVQRGPAISDPGKWTFPGGASDSKETPHEGATRETIEELGLKDDVFKDALVHGDHTFSVPNSTWKYTTVAASVPTMIKPNLTTAHARAETSDAKWMTLAEIQALDKSGALHHPIAGGKLEQNVISLYPKAGAQTLGQVVRPGPVSKRPGRLNLPPGGRQAPSSFNAWPHPHKQSKGKDLIPDKATVDAQRQKIKQDRKLYDGKTADGRLAAIGAQQGFDDTPTVLDKKEIDRLLATGDYIEAWRGVSGAGGYNWRSNKSNGKTAGQINEEMRSGPAYYGKGIFGNGYYLATQKRVAEQYADGTKGSIARILIPKSAITQKYDKVSAESHKNPRHSKAKGSTSYEDSTFYDPGRYAAAKGIDGIEIEPHHRSPGGGAGHVAAHGKPAFNWLNRSVLIIQKEPG